jgi:hypothetical protein
MEMVQAGRNISAFKGIRKLSLASFLFNKKSSFVGRFSGYIFVVIDWKLDAGQRDVYYSSGQVDGSSTHTPTPTPPSAPRSVTNDQIFVGVLAT